MIQEKQETSWKKILKQEGISNGIQVILVRGIEGHQGSDRESKKLGGGGLSSRCHYQSLNVTNPLLIQTQLAHMQKPVANSLFLLVAVTYLSQHESTT